MFCPKLHPMAPCTRYCWINMRCLHFEVILPSLLHVLAYLSQERSLYLSPLHSLLDPLHSIYYRFNIYWKTHTMIIMGVIITKVEMNPHLLCANEICSFCCTWGHRWFIWGLEGRWSGETCRRADCDSRTEARPRSRSAVRACSSSCTSCCRWPTGRKFPSPSRSPRNVLLWCPRTNLICKPNMTIILWWTRSSKSGQPLWHWLRNRVLFTDFFIFCRR